jgi:6-phosphogluconolactonase
MTRQIFPTPDDLAAAGADLFVRLAQEAIGARGRFMVALSGGSTPKAMFGRLAAAPHAEAIDWSKLHLFWSDERAVPPEHVQSNYRTARESLLDLVRLPSEQVHRVRTERQPLLLAAEEYAAEIRRAFGGKRGSTPRFDLIMLGMGDDGHIASLFPQTEALDDQHRLVAPNHVPKLNAQRLTFTPKLINAADAVLFLVAGAGKADALQAVLEGPREPRLYPAQLIAPEHGTVYWYLDAAAASKLRQQSD